VGKFSGLWWCLLIGEFMGSGKLAVMENGAQRTTDETMEDEELLDQQRLIISVNALNSIVSFVMDTLVQHRDLGGSASR
jgi:hypothetical protein